MKTILQAAAGAVFVCFIFLTGCNDKFWDPTQVGRFRPVPAVNVILDSLGVAEEEPSAWEGAEEPKPADLRVLETDYVFAPGDTVRITIFELLTEGQLFTNDFVVTETGKISIPEVGTVEAAGLTESELQDEIVGILAPTILKTPSVTVALLTSQQRTFSILGDGVRRPDRYVIPRYDFRLADALATAGGFAQFNVSNIYVSRPLTGREPVVQPAPAAAPAVPGTAAPASAPDYEKEMLEIIKPSAKKQPAADAPVMTSTEMVTDRELAALAAPQGIEPLPISQGIAANKAGQISSEPNAQPKAGQGVQAGQGQRIEWVFQDGKWVPMQIGQPAPPAEQPEQPQAYKTGSEKPIEEKVPSSVAMQQIGTGGAQARVIQIPADKLRGGDPRYNIIIKPGDSIQVPVDIVGEFYIMGNTNNSGPIVLTGRPMTLKMAIASAGGLGPLAWPKKCEVVRRIGKNREEIVMVDLDKIASGEQPDFFIKPNDVINVGTHTTARFRAIMRNTFRATYGFGYVYDRNFADRDFGTNKLLPSILF